MREKDFLHKTNSKSNGRLLRMLIKMRMQQHGPRSRRENLTKHSRSREKKKQGRMSRIEKSLRSSQLKNISIPNLHPEHQVSYYTFHIHSIYIPYTFHIHSIYIPYIPYTLHIHYIYIPYTLHIHYIYIPYTLHIHYIYITYTLHIHSI